MKHERLATIIRWLSNLVVFVGMIVSLFWFCIGISAVTTIPHSSSLGFSGLLTVFYSLSIVLYSCFIAAMGYAFAALVENTDALVERFIKTTSHVEEPDPRFPSLNGKIMISGIQKKCPVCAQMIDIDTIKCRFCGNEFDSDEITQQLKEHRICPYCYAEGVMGEVLLGSGRMGHYCPSCRKYIEYVVSGEENAP